MKRSSKVMLVLMGTAAAGSALAAVPANAACDPVRPGFAMPGFDPYATRCETRGGFGGSGRHFGGHAHGHGGQGHSGGG
jgi:hypothetical protein